MPLSINFNADSVGNLSGRPAANSVTAGYVYQAIDVGGYSVSDGISWYDPHAWSASQALISSGTLTGSRIAIGSSIIDSTSTAALYIDSSGKLAQDITQFTYSDGMLKASKQVSTKLLIKLDASAGTEKVTNGSFTGAATSWTLGAAWHYGTNAVNKDTDGTTTLAQDVTAVKGQVYSVTYTISALTVGSVTVTVGGVDGTLRSDNGTYTDIINSNTTGNLIFTPSNTARFTLDTVSVKKIGLWAGVHIADPSSGDTVDAEARTAINAILDILEAYGFTATS